MRWTHDLYPLIDTLELSGVDSCETIAQRLNQKISEPNFTLVFDKLQPHVNNFSKSYRTFKENPLSCKNDDNCQTFCISFKHMYDLYKQIDLFKTKTKTKKHYLVKASNISNVLQVKKINKTAKG